MIDIPVMLPSMGVTEITENRNGITEKQSI